MIKVGVVGYGTIGKRVADAVLKQDDMKLVGVSGHTYNWRMEIANSRDIKIYTVADDTEFKENNITPAGNFDDLLKAVDIIVDCSPKKIGAEHKEKYGAAGIKAIFQGGEKHDTVEASFVAQCNFDDVRSKQFVRVVSCNTTGLSRTLHALDKAIGVEQVHATMIRRGADPADIKHGPINAIVPVLELPSHHGPDVRTVLYDMEIFTTALTVPSTLMHMHNVTVDLEKEATVEQILEVWRTTPRVRLVRNAEKVRSTAEIMEFARDLGNERGDMHSICIWEEGVGVYKKKLFYMQAIHQESDVVPENIDCIRAMCSDMSCEESIAKTDAAIGSL